MATVRSTFIQAINNGMSAAKMISDPGQKANAYAALASAMAQTGLINISADGEFDEAAAAPATPAASTPAKGKDALKPGASKAGAKSPAAPAPTPEPEPAAEAPEPELTEEWTEDMIALKADQIAYISNLRETYEEDQLNAVVAQFSENTMNSLDEITPLNVDAFVAFVETLLADAE